MTNGATERLGAEFDGNRLGSKDDDRFGFGVVAKLIADAVTRRSGPECLVVGLEGEWGSGKSTLLAMLADEFEARGGTATPFAPWVIGSRDALLQLLFSTLDRAVAAQRLDDGDATGTTVEAAREGLARFRTYSSAVAGFGRLAGFAGAVSLLPGGAIVEKALENLAKTMKEGVHEETLEDIKKRTSEALGKLNRRIVVTIDDLDRLEPSEAVEVLRLVQAVADFPNVSYVLSYDRRRLARSVESVTKLEDGSAYLEKLIQVVVPLPQPQPVALVDMFTRRLKELTGIEELGDPLVEIVTNHVGPRIATPRGIIRVLDSLKLLWPELKGKVDLSDLVWLQMVRAEDDRLYRWMEAYVAEAARPTTDVARAAARRRFSADLDQLLGATMADPRAPDWAELRSFLPMVKNTSGSSRAEELFVPNDAKEVLAKMHGKRLGSVEHARMYFGLLPPDGVTAQKEFEALLATSGEGPQVAERLVGLARHKSDAGPALIELVLDLVRISLSQLSRVQLVGLSTGLLRSVDDLVRLAPVADRGIFRESLSRLLGKLSELVGYDDWSAVLDASLKGDAAIDLLAVELPQDGTRRPSWIEAEEHSARARSHLATAYARRDDPTLVRLAQHGRALTAWRFADEDARRDFLGRVLADDALFRELVLGRFRSLVVNQQQSMRDVGGTFFVHELDEWYGRGTVKDRLRNMTDVDQDEWRTIESVLNLLDGTA